MRNRLVSIEFTGVSEAQQASGPNAPKLRESPQALYIHVPFCFHKCHYCDFYSLVEPEGRDRQSEYVDALIAELHSRNAEAPLRPRTIFTGGGTPTLLRVELWDRLLLTLHDLDALREVEEFTVEANPETVTHELMQRLAAGGVNRVSIGAQSFDPAMLKALERWHEPANVRRAVDLCRHVGIDNVNLDLIFAIPGQTLPMLDADLGEALRLQPDHLSCYGLTYEPNTPLTMKLRLGRIRPMEEDVEAQMYARVIDRLAQAGFEQYEISNWSRPGRACVHNLAYWRNLDWLGVGPGAASHAGGWRWKNQPHLGRYLSGTPSPPVVDVEHLDADARLGEALMLRLRLREGAPHGWLRDHVPAADKRWSTLRELVDLGLLEHTPTHVRLTGRGVFVADAVVARLL